MASSTPSGGQNTQGDSAQQEPRRPASQHFLEPEKQVEFLSIDVVDLLGRASKIAPSLADVLVCIYMKEPRTTAAFFEAGAPRGNVGLAKEAFERVWVAVDNAPHVAELKQLSRQGVARFMGSIAIGRAFGLLEKVRPDDAGSSPMLRLGQTKIPYIAAGAQTPCEPLSTFLSVCKELQNSWEELLRGGCASVYAEVRRLVIASTLPKLLHESTRSGAQKAKPKTPEAEPAAAQTPSEPAGAQTPSDPAGAHTPSVPAAAQTPSEPTSGDGYLVDFGVRKVTILLIHLGVIKPDWWKVGMGELRRMSCDQSEFLQHLPGHWSAADVSSLMFGHDDLAPFVSMYTCLLKEVYDTSHPRACKKYLRQAMQGEYPKMVSRYRAVHGVTPCPFNAFTAWNDAAPAAAGRKGSRSQETREGAPAVAA